MFDRVPPRRLFIVVVFVVMGLGGMFYAPYLFPDLAPWRSMTGGLLLGAFWAICGLSRQLLEW